jgi:ribose/xylose/arabinose/galactoside ABC-type transport system permease subunit
MIAVPSDPPTRCRTVSWGLGTRLGRYMYAIGANPEAARRAGINVPRVRRIAFVFSAMTAGIAGLVYVSVLGSISTDVDGGHTRCTGWRRP